MDDLINREFKDYVGDAPAYERRIAKAAFEAGWRYAMSNADISSKNCAARIELVNAIHDLASNFENVLGAFGGDAEGRKKAEGDIAWAMKVAKRHNYNGPMCKGQPNAEVTGAKLATRPR